LKSSIPPRSERKKLIPLASMFFFILFNYTILRDTKDVLMVTAKKSGAEVIPFIKTYVNLPAAIGFTALYSKLCDRMEQRDGELKFMRNELRRMNISSFLVIFTI
jgi:AAA family ATP:ADP antiporter